MQYHTMQLAKTYQLRRKKRNIKCKKSTMQSKSSRPVLEMPNVPCERMLGEC